MRKVESQKMILWLALTTRQTTIGETCTDRREVLINRNWWVWFAKDRTVEVNEIAKTVKPECIGGLKGESKEGSAAQRESRKQEARLSNYLRCCWFWPLVELPERTHSLTFNPFPSFWSPNNKFQYTSNSLSICGFTTVWNSFLHPLSFIYFR